MNWSKELVNGQAPVYLIHGDEGFLIRQASAWLRASVLADGIEDFNLDRFDGRESVDATRISQACRTIPMMAPKRMVWVRNADSVFGRSKDALKGLLDYLSQPDETTCLLFESTTRIKKNSVLYKRIQKAGHCYEAKTLRDRELPAWIKGRVRARGRQIESSAADAIVESLGGDLAAVDAAIERLTLYVEAPAVIGRDDVRACVPQTRERTVWELVDAVAERNVSAALTRAHQLMDQGKAPLQLLALVIRQFRQLLIGHDVRTRGGSVAEAAQQAGIPHFRERQFGAQLRNYHGSELVAALHRLERTDSALKSSKLPHTMLFEAMILDLCAPKTGQS